MATTNNTIKTRIQLKSDTEANWNKAGPKNGSLGFIPLRGELIIYSADETHAFSRLKIGNGETNVVDLPFIDSGTLNGKETEIIQYSNKQSFPQSGSEDKLYVDLTTNRIYCYSNNVGYNQLSNFTYNVSTTSINTVGYWGAGSMTNVSVENNTLIITNGITPQLLTSPVSVVTGVTKVVNNE